MCCAKPYPPTMFRGCALSMYTFACSSGAQDYSELLCLIHLESDPHEYDRREFWRKMPPATIPRIVEISNDSSNCTRKLHAEFGSMTEIVEESALRSSISHRRQQTVDDVQLAARLNVGLLPSKLQSETTQIPQQPKSVSCSPRDKDLGAVSRNPS